MSSPPERQPLNICLIAGEHSGDALGAKLMQALTETAPVPPKFTGLGGEAMQKQGLTSLFPMEEVAIMGPLAIAARLPSLIKRVHQCVDMVVGENPDLLVIIDSPEFTHPIAKRVRKAAKHIPIINYVSPTVWAWRPGRAKKMQPYVDEVLALLPFEPNYHQQLGGPPCTYVGHPLIEKKQWIDDLDEAAFKKKYQLIDAPLLVLLPGSRPNEIKHLLRPFEEVTEKIQHKLGNVQLVLPVVKSVRDTIARATQNWRVTPTIISDETDKFTAFKTADAALAASGTVTLELALTGTPMVVAYKYDKILHLLRPLIKANMFALANHILGQKAFPELIQADCTPDKILSELLPLFDETAAPTRQQKQMLDQITGKLFAAGPKPSHAAAERCLAHISPPAQ